MIYIKDGEKYILEKPQQYNNGTIWWSGEKGIMDSFWFSFDKKEWFRFYNDYPDKLTPEQIEIFKKENPYLARLK